MYKHIDTLDNVNLDDSHTLVYANDQYYLHIININTNSIIEKQLNGINERPKFISVPMVFDKCVWWQIIDTLSNINLFIICNDGKVIMYANALNLPFIETMISLPITNV